MGIEEHMERGNPKKLSGKVWVYGTIHKKIYASYMTDKPETILAETSSLTGTSNIVNELEALDQLVEKMIGHTGLFFSPLYALENKTPLLETDTDLLSVGELRNMKKLQEEILTVSNLYSLIQKTQQKSAAKKQEPYDMPTFMNEYLIPYLDSVTQNLNNTQSKKQKLLDYPTTKDLPKNLTKEMQRITQVWENPGIQTQIKQAWLGLQVAFIDSSIKAQKDEQEYNNTAKLKKERDNFARQYNI